MLACTSVHLQWADALPWPCLQLIPANQYPTAICQEKTVNADNPTDQTNSVYGTNANGRMCGAVLDATTAVDNGAPPVCVWGCR